MHVEDDGSSDDRDGSKVLLFGLFAVCVLSPPATATPRRYCSAFSPVKPDTDVVLTHVPLFEYGLHLARVLVRWVVSSVVVVSTLTLVSFFFFGTPEVSVTFPAAIAVVEVKKGDSEIVAFLSTTAATVVASLELYRSLVLLMLLLLYAVVSVPLFASVIGGAAFWLGRGAPLLAPAVVSPEAARVAVVLLELLVSAFPAAMFRSSRGGGSSALAIAPVDILATETSFVLFAATLREEAIAVSVASAGAAAVGLLVTFSFLVD